MIFHITSQAAWRSAQAAGKYTHPSLEAEGFIHASSAHQVTAVANAFYRGQQNLVLLVIDESRLTPELRWEAPSGPPAPGISGSDRFPHIYGHLNADAVVRTVDLNADAAGNFVLPPLEQM
jgi:uncharacterized protein (DUF952 family)